MAGSMTTRVSLSLLLFTIFISFDKAIEQCIRENIGTTWHSIATCKMAPREENGVVDGRLNVWGTKGLKLADLSIPPMNVSANTNNTAMVIGEKAADFIIKDLGL